MEDYDNIVFSQGWQVMGLTELRMEVHDKTTEGRRKVVVNQGR